MKINHYIIIRFSHSYFNKELCSFVNFLSVERLQKKLDFFKKTCYKSLMKQTEKNFKIFVFVHNDCPVEIFQQLQELNIEIKKGRLEDVELDTNCTHIITTRMDDDDMLHKDAVKQIQDCCKEKTKLKVCGFKNGVTWNVKENTYAQYWRKCDIGFIGIGESLISDVKFYKQTGFHIFSFAPSIIRTEIIKKSFNPEWQIIQNIFPSFIYSRYSDQSSMHIKGWVKRTHFSKNTVEKKIIKKYF